MTRKSVIWSLGVFFAWIWLFLVYEYIVKYSSQNSTGKVVFLRRVPMYRFVTVPERFILVHFHPQSFSYPCTFIHVRFTWSSAQICVCVWGGGVCVVPFIHATSVETTIVMYVCIRRQSCVCIILCEDSWSWSCGWYSVNRGGSRICKKGGPGGWYNPKIAQK